MNEVAMLLIKEVDLNHLNKSVSDLLVKVERLTARVEEPVDIKRVAEHLKVSVKTVQRKLSEGLPVHKFGQLDRFYLSEVNEWLKDQ